MENHIAFPRPQRLITTYPTATLLRTLLPEITAVTILAMVVRTMEIHATETPEMQAHLPTRPRLPRIILCNTAIRHPLIPMATTQSIINIKTATTMDPCNLNPTNLVVKLREGDEAICPEILQIS